MLSSKEKKLESLKNKYLEEEKAKHPEEFDFPFTPCLNESQMTFEKRARTTRQFLRDVNYWHKVTNENTQKKRQEAEQSQLNHSFRPQISNNTLKIFKVFIALYFYIISFVFKITF